jgi:hypothetical protein
MNQSEPSNRRLSQFFLIWIVLAQAILLLTPFSAVVDHWLGAGFLWALAIPLTCLVWLNPRRSWGLLLAAFGMLVFALIRLCRSFSQGRPGKAGLLHF